MKTMTIYDLLGLVKDRKAPKKVLIKDKIYYLLVDEEHYVYSQSKDTRGWDLFIDKKINISQNLDLEVLILDENYLENKSKEEKKIPEKLNDFDIQGLEVSGYSMTQAEYLLEDGIKENREMINWILDYLKSKGE